MASTKPIPSKLVINTLRGVVFTTSCSVILLAEERRRRIKIARAAVENARKLHTAKVNRGAIALGDGYVSWDGRLIDPSDEILATMPIRTSRRRRTSNAQIAADAKSLSSSKTTDSTLSESQLAQRAAKTAAARESIRQPILFSAPPQTFQNERLKISPTGVDASETPKHKPVQATISTPVSTASPSAVEAAPVAEAVKETPKSRMVLFNESTEALESILAKSRKQGMSTVDAKRCSDMLEKLRDAGKFHGPRAKEINELLLRVWTQSKGDAVLSNQVLEASLCLSRTPEHVLGPCVSESLRQGDKQQTTQITSFFHKHPSASVHLPKVFRHLAMTQVSRADASKLFETLLGAGVFQADSEYQVVRQLVLHAKKERDFAWILTQESTINNTAPKNMAADTPLQTAITAAQAYAGNLEAVRSTAYKLLKSTSPAPTELKQLVSEATDLLAKNQPAAQLDQWLRSIVDDFGLVLEPRWAKAVSNAYMAKLSPEMESWSKFCTDNGVATPQVPRLDASNQHHSDATTAALIDAAQARGEDVSEALSSLLMAQLKEGHDPKDILLQASCRGVRVHDSVYNSAAQQLATRGDFRGAARVCKLAAKENGQGQLAYSEYNFSNLVYIYTGSARYEALHSVLDEFRSSDQMRWQGSKICKESVKLAMKTVAQRATVQGGEDSEHYQALLDLDATLCHVQQCRRANAAARANKSAENIVRVAVPPSCSVSAQNKMSSEADQVIGV